MPVINDISLRLHKLNAALAEACRQKRLAFDGALRFALFYRDCKDTNIMVAEAETLAASDADTLKYEKLGKWMNAQGAPAYKLGNNYAVADHVANKGTLMYISGPKNLIKSLNGIRIAGKVLTLTAIAVDTYEICSSHYNPRTVTSVVGGWTGAWVGAKFGSMAGTSVGFTVGGVGEIVGAPAGALIGGIVGCFCGRQVTETIYDIVTQKGMPIGGR